MAECDEKLCRARRSSQDGQFLRTTVFKTRESALTVVLENSPEAKSVYSIAASQLLLFIMYTMFKYIVDPEVLDTDVQFLSSQLSGMGAFIDSWIGMHVALILVIYPLTKLWMMNECKHFALYAIALLPPFLFILIHPVYTLLENNFLYILTFSITVEQVRILMKTISFIVENHRKVVYSSDHLASLINNNVVSDVSQKTSDGLCAESKGALNFHIPTLNQLIYFLFAPTLIYRDEYPRSQNKNVNWRRVTSLLTEFGAIIFLGLQIVNRVTSPRLSKIGIEPLRLTDLIDDYIRLTMVAVLCTFGLGYGFLHCWLNAWAEALHFGDREFYKNWWTSVNFSQFWRRWNGVVQPWIYEYLYKPMIYFTGGNRLVATIAVFVVSAVVHEHVTGFALGALLPMFAIAMLAFCPFIVAFHFLRRLSEFHCSVFVYTVNWIVWSTTLYGYGMEVFSRVNCPAHSDSLIESIKPRLLSCVHIKW